MWAAVTEHGTPEGDLSPYIPRLLPPWLATATTREHRSVEGSLVLLDISGFTRLTERLARRGREGAEELSDLLDATFGALLADPLLADPGAEGADLLKWGGDAVLLLFSGRDSAARACRSAVAMRRTLSRVGHLSTGVGSVVLQASVGVHTGRFDLFLVGAPEVHRELVVAGPGTTETVRMEVTAAAGQIVVSPATGALLGAGPLGEPAGTGRLLARAPKAAPPLPRQRLAPDDSARLAPLALPPQQRSHLLDPAREPEHRAAAVGFVQYAGTDDLLAAEGPDVVLAALDEVVRNIQEACVLHDVGFHESDVDANGGKAMLVAGAPRSAGDDTDRLLQAARLIVDRAGRLPLRAGVTAGHVFAGDFGPAHRRTFSVKGDVVNLAARLMARAEPGQVLATRDLLDGTRHRFAAAELAPFAVKGKAGPVRAVALGAALGRRHNAITDLMVGRDAELGLLTSALEAAKERHGHLVDLLGEPGIGKTRLVEELLTRSGDVVVLQIECEPYGSRTPYLAVRGMLRDLLGLHDGTDGRDVAERLRTRVEPEDPELVPWLPLLGAPLEVELPQTPQTAELDPAFRTSRLEEVTLRFLDAALPTPTLLVVEDAHHMDEASAGLLRRLVTGIVRRPWLVVVARRHVPVGFVPEPGEDVTSLRLAPLSTQAAQALAEVASDAEPLPPATIDELVDRAAGHPLFLRELVAAATRGGQDLGDLPTSVEDLVVTQIDELPARERSVLRHAAVLGVSFSARTLRRMLPPDPVANAVEVLRRLDPFLESEGRGRLRFRHALHRDVAYAGLPYRRRRQLHERAGALLEHEPDAVATRPELLSMHFFEAGRWEKAWHYGRVAGDRARTSYAQVEAAQAYARAAEAARRVPELVPATERAVVLEALGDARFHAGLSEDAAAAFREALRTVRGDGRREAELALKLSRVDQRLGHYPQALRRVRRGLNALGPPGSADDPTTLGLRAHLATRYAVCRISQGRYDDARHWGRQAVSDAEAAGQRDALAHAHLALHTVDLWSGEPAPAPHGELALWLFEDLGDLLGQGHCENNLAMRAVFEGRWVEAVEMFERAARTFHRIGDAGDEANAVYNRADVLIRQGRHREALPLLDETLRVARAVGDEELVALVLRESGRAVAGIGDPVAASEAALVRFADARARFVALGEPHEVVDTDAAVAQCLLLAGRPQEAIDVLDVAVRNVGSGGSMLLPTLHRLRGSALLVTGDLVGARRELEEGLRLGSAPEVRHEHGFLLAALSRVAAREGAKEAEQVAGQAAAVLEALGVLRVPLPDDL